MKIIKFENRKKIPDISLAWETLRKSDFFGSQYEWLACFATEHQGIELSVHEDDKAVILINKYGKLKKCNDPVLGEYNIVDRKKSDTNIVKIFGDYPLPLVSWTKLKTKEYYLANGYEDVMNLTWFCYNPIKDKPCGTCNPCMYTIEEGMRERFFKYAIFRYYCKKILLKLHIFEVFKKMKNL